MKQTIYIALILLLGSSPLLGHGPAKSNLAGGKYVIASLIAGSGSEKQSLVDKYTRIIEEVVVDLEDKKEKWANDEKLLAHLFRKIHRKYFLQYKPYDSFEKLMESGEYGCLTATAFFALVLEGLGYEYGIYETNYHIYLMVHAGDKRYLLESTDAVSGFVSDENEISQRLDTYKKDNRTEGSSADYQYIIDVNQQINLSQLVGLQYYNEAVNGYNNGDLSEALNKLEKAARYYKSERIKEFLNLIFRSVDDPTGLESVLLKFDELSSLAAVSAP